MHGLTILKKKKNFFGLGKYHPIPNTTIQSLVKVQKYLKKKIAFLNQSLPGHLPEITP